jgi:beta-1,4-N-acetylglucosaminyltransferase
MVVDIELGTVQMPVCKTIIPITSYSLKPLIKNDMVEADLIISHCGAGSILEILEMNKKLIVVVNSALVS